MLFRFFNVVWCLLSSHWWPPERRRRRVPRHLTSSRRNNQCVCAFVGRWTRLHFNGQMCTTAGQLIQLIHRIASSSVSAASKQRRISIWCVRLRRFFLSSAVFFFCFDWWIKGRVVIGRGGVRVFLGLVKFYDVWKTYDKMFGTARGGW